MKKNEKDESRARLVALRHADIAPVQRGTLSGKETATQDTQSRPVRLGCANVRDINDPPRLTRRLSCTRVLRVRWYNAACIPLPILFARCDEVEILRARHILKTISRKNDKSLFYIHISFH